MARTDSLGNFLTDVADAIREKKGTSEAIQASDFDTEIESISGGGDASEYFNEFTSSSSPSQWATANYIKKLPDIVIPNNVTSIGGLFDRFNIKMDNAPKIIAGSNITNIDNLFRLSSIKNVELSGIDMTNVNNFTSVFEGCEELLSVNLGNGKDNFRGSIGSMFKTCRQLTEIDLSNLSGTLTNCVYAFNNCYYLAKLDIRNLDFTSLTATYTYSYAFNGIPNDCLIIVKDQANKDWITSKFSNLTNVQTLEEYEASL